jgi:hypothetical protein
MQKTIDAVLAAVQTIKASGFGYAGEKITHGHLALYTLPADCTRSSAEYLLVPLFEGTDFPLRRIVQDADGSYRCASPHIAGEVSAAELSLQDAVDDFNGSSVNKGGNITRVMAFGTKPVVSSAAPLLPEPDAATVDAIKLELAFSEHKADELVGAVINGETVVLLVAHEFGGHKHVEYIASVGDNLLCVSNETNYIALGNGYLYAAMKEAEANPAIGHKRLQQNRDIYEAVIKANGHIKDHHNNGSRMTQFTHIATFGRPGKREVVVGLYEGTHQCLNELFIDEQGQPGLSTCSVGGNLYHPEVEMADRIHTYSDFNGNTLWNLVALTK